MAPQILRAKDRTPAPWKNGGGVTSEVAADPPGAGTGDFLWRISVADVGGDGPFSAFPGIDRIITVVDGPGMELTVDDVPHRLDTLYEPFAFSGDAVTGCRLLGGPIVDFNVMVRRSGTTATVRVVRSTTVVRPTAGTVVVAAVLAGSAVFRPAQVRLGHLDAVLLAHGDDGTFDVNGVLAVVHLEPGLLRRRA
ncbi:HutD family protein [Streptomyces sp. SAI-129]|uniref:HutD/Ves family protein n=1 Tax=Streptomyces sp. SAI-129 TaxID=3377727 RepID=UPI003C7BA8C2